jgi:hypothetical protein
MSGDAPNSTKHRQQLKRTCFNAAGVCEKAFAAGRNES